MILNTFALLFDSACTRFVEADRVLVMPRFRIKIRATKRVEAGANAVIVPMIFDIMRSTWLLNKADSSKANKA